jgi:hypothetical protein
MMEKSVQSRVWTLLLLAAGVALLAGAVWHARQHMHGPPPRPAQRTAARDPSRVAEWMTLRYVARAYNVPEPVLLRAVQVGPLQARGHTLRGIAAAKGVETQTVLAEVREAIRRYREANPVRPSPTPRAAP